jgi:PAS domain S-box-containing protein
LDALPLGVFVLAKDGAVRFWNRAIEQWTGIGRDAIIGRPIAEFFDSLRRPRYVERLENVFESGAPLILSSQLHGQIVPCTLPSGEPRVQHATVTAIPSAAGGFDALFAIQDVTDLTHRVDSSRKMRDQALAAKDELKLQAQRLTETQQELERFVHFASHDLQEPLRTLIAYAAFLEEDAGDALPPQAASRLELIRRSAGRMQRVIEDMLALAHAARTELALAPVDLGECLRSARASIQDRNTETQTDIESDRLPSAFGDRSLLEHVFQNLLQNAIKFRRADCPTVVRISSKLQAGEWRITVADNGIGIEPRYAESVFEPFFRLHPSSVYEGSGVGLAFCRGVLARHRGRIWVGRREGPGTAVHFTLPAPAEGETEIEQDANDDPRS